MSEVEEGEILTGGTINRPVRIGNTVRRNPGAGAEAIHALLIHLEAVGFPYSPRFLGVDAQGREILSYIPGLPIMRPWPETFRSPSGLREAGRVVRLYHEAVAGFQPSENACWFNGARAMLPGEIIIHGDLGPWNIIVDGSGSIVGIIDWDFARPAPAISDIAYLAFYLALLRRDEIVMSAGFEQLPLRSERLSEIAQAYGADPITLATEGYRMELEQLLRIRSLGPTGSEPWRGFLERGMDLDIQLDLDWFNTNIHKVVLGEL